MNDKLIRIAESSAILTGVLAKRGDDTLERCIRNAVRRLTEDIAMPGQLIEHQEHSSSSGTRLVTSVSMYVVPPEHVDFVTKAIERHEAYTNNQSASRNMLGDCQDGSRPTPMD